MTVERSKRRFLIPLVFITEGEYDGHNVQLPNKFIGKGDEVLISEIKGLGYLIKISGKNWA